MCEDGAKTGINCCGDVTPCGLEIAGVGCSTPCARSALGRWLREALRRAGMPRTQLLPWRWARLVAGARLLRANTRRALSGRLRYLLCDAVPKLLRVISLDGPQLLADGLNSPIEVNSAVGDEHGLSRRDCDRIRGDKVWRHTSNERSGGEAGSAGRRRRGC